MAEQTRDDIKPLNVYLSENTKSNEFSIRFRIDKQAVGFSFKYTRCGRDNGYEKANNKIEELQTQYDNIKIINKIGEDKQTKTKCDNLQEYKRQYREANKDRIREIDKQSRDANKEKIRETTRHYRLSNKDKVNEARRQYYENNKEKIQERQQLYRDQHRDKINERAMEQMERLRLGVAESNGTTTRVVDA